ncbi:MULTISPECIES: DDE-type integrase/transposase/recombinase [unclassified Burkholderia]|uniref:DDE-type integrase/transposase/recombinase n=1 Tax=unclassified Burkholderia TaxID=2613784 RepID=UPI001F0459BB|nr:MULTISPECIES: DDE-type integrase/transposase/recombinase [unclassified Burkholderia]
MHWLWRAVDQHSAVLDVLVQRRRDAAATKLPKRHGGPRAMMRPQVRSSTETSLFLAAHRQAAWSPCRFSSTGNGSPRPTSRTRPCSTTASTSRGSPPSRPISSCTPSAISDSSTAGAS